MTFPRQGTTAWNANERLRHSISTQGGYWWVSNPLAKIDGWYLIEFMRDEVDMVLDTVWGGLEGIDRVS